MTSRLPLAIVAAASAIMFGSIVFIAAMVVYTIATGDAVDFGGVSLEQDPTRDGS